MPEEGPSREQELAFTVMKFVKKGITLSFLILEQTGACACTGRRRVHQSMSERQKRRQKSLRQERGGKNRHQSNIQVQLPENGVRPSRTSIAIAATPPQMSTMQFPSESARRRRRELAGTQELASRCVLISLSARHNISFPLTPPSFTYVFISSFTYLQGSWSNFIYPKFPPFLFIPFVYIGK